MQMNDHGISLNRHCPCTQSQCPIRGNCVLCIQNHLNHKRHVPECIQNLIRPAIESLAGHVELHTEDARPDGDFWKDFDSDTHLRSSLEEHGKK